MLVDIWSQGKEKKERRWSWRDEIITFIHKWCPNPRLQLWLQYLRNKKFQLNSIH